MGIPVPHKEILFSSHFDDFFSVCNETSEFVQLLYKQRAEEILKLVASIKCV